MTGAGQSWKVRIALVLAVLGVGWAAWIGWHVLRVRSDLLAARAAATALRADLERADLPAARAHVAALAAHADAATRDSGVRLWTPTMHLPLIGPQLRQARELTWSVRDLSTSALTPAARALDLLERQPPVADGAVDVVELQHLSGLLDQAVSGLRETAGRVHRQRGGSDLLPVLSEARRTFADDLRTLMGDLVPLQRALHLAPAMLGADGPRTYMIAVQNPAEARATGGLIAAYSLVRVDHGRLTQLGSGTNQDFHNPPKVFSTVYGGLEAGGTGRDAALGTFFGVNATPDWPSAAARLAGLWEAQTGQHLDGVLGLTPQALARVLAVTGPVRLSDGTSVSGRSVVRFVQVDEYHRFSRDNPGRKSAVGELAGLMVDKLVHAKLGLSQLRRAGLGSLGTGDLTLWSAHADEESRLRQTSVSGALPALRSFVQVVTVNTGGGKMDAFLQRRTTVRRLPVTGDVLVTTTLTNTLTDPASLAPVQASRLDDHRLSVPRGSARDLVSVYGGIGSQEVSTTLDGAPVAALLETDLGHSRTSVDVEVEPGRSRTVAVVLHEAPGPITYRVQPLAVPERHTVSG